MNLRLSLGLLSIISLPLTFLYLGYFIGPMSNQVNRLTVAKFSLQMTDGSKTPAQTVTLPHKWPISIAGEPAFAEYIIPLPDWLLQVTMAVSLRNHMPITEIALGNQKIAETTRPSQPGEILLARLPEAATGETLLIRVPAHFGFRGGLDALLLAPTEILDRQTQWLRALREINHLSTMGLTLVVAIFCWCVFCMRGGALLLSLGLAATGSFIHHTLPFVFGYWPNDGFELALYSASSTCIAVGLFFFIELATHRRWDVVSAFVIIGFMAILLVQSGSFFDFELRREINVAFIGTVMLLSCFRCGPHIISQHQWLLLLLLVFFVIRTLAGIHSLIINNGLFGYDDVEHQLRLAPFTILGLILLSARHIHMAFKNYEMANIGMAREIESYKAELSLLSQKEQALAVQKAASAERLHWMQEIHDGLGSHLIAARFLADKATDPDGLNAVRESIDDSLEDLRELVESLSPEQSTLPSLLGALRYRIAPRYERAGLRLLWSVDPMIEAAELSPADALNVQRITQEALTNILKHAQATTVRVHIFTRGSSIVLRIEDDGSGFAPDLSYPGRGIENMKKRARDCKGELTLTAIDPGMRVELSLPNG